MDRQIVYPGAIPLDTDILSIQRNAMIAQGFAAQAMLGTGTVANGLACTPTSPASMAVNIGPGSISSLSTVDATAFGSLALDTSDALVKVGINLTAVLSSTLGTITAPGTAGQSQVYLISAAFSESDANAVLLPYYNAANPAVAYSGPSNSGAAQNTQRIQRVNLTLTAGAAATTGTQTTPATPGGQVPLWAITVAYGASTIVSGNIAAAAGAPFVGGGSLLPGRLIGMQKWTAHGTATYTPTVGTNSVIWEVLGPSGSSGGVAAAGAGNVAVTGGGASGSYAKAKTTSGFAGATVVVGQGAAAPAAGNNNGGSGTASSVTGTFGTISAPSGGGSFGSAAYAWPIICTGGTPGALPTVTGATAIVSAQGDAGSPGFCVNVTNLYVFSGKGGMSTFGQGAAGVGANTTGLSSGTAGAGPSGSCSANGGSAQAGGGGTDGQVIAWEYS